MTRTLMLFGLAVIAASASWGGSLPTLREKLSDEVRRERLIELSAALEKIDSGDPDALFKLGLKAQAMGLDTKCCQLFERVILLNSNHAEARKALGYIRQGEGWKSFSEIVELANKWMVRDRERILLKRVIPKLEEIVSTPQQWLQVNDLKARAYLGLRQFDQAHKVYETLSHQTKTWGLYAEFRFRFLADLLSRYPKGNYLLECTYPPDANLLGREHLALHPGEVSLSEPMVLQAALFEKAKQLVDAGFRLASSAKELTVLSKASQVLGQAAERFNQADSLSPKISSSYRQDLVLMQITVLRKQVDLGAAEFDSALAELDNHASLPEEYYRNIRNLLDKIQVLHQQLQTIVVLSDPYAYHFKKQRSRTVEDLQRIESLRDIFLEELKGGAEE